jgi:hypothetical protein
VTPTPITPTVYPPVVDQLTEGADVVTVDDVIAVPAAFEQPMTDGEEAL